MAAPFCPSACRTIGSCASGLSAPWRHRWVLLFFLGQSIPHVNLCWGGFLDRNRIHHWWSFSTVSDIHENPSRFNYSTKSVMNTSSYPRTQCFTEIHIASICKPLSNLWANPRLSPFGNGVPSIILVCPINSNQKSQKNKPAIVTTHGWFLANGGWSNNYDPMWGPVQPSGSHCRMLQRWPWACCRSHLKPSFCALGSSALVSSVVHCHRRESCLYHPFPGADWKSTQQSKTTRLFGIRPTTASWSYSAENDHGSLPLLSVHKLQTGLADLQMQKSATVAVCFSWANPCVILPKHSEHVAMQMKVAYAPSLSWDRG